MCEAGNRAHIRQTVYSSQLMTIKTQSNEITPTVPTFPMQPISSPSTCFLCSHLHKVQGDRGYFLKYANFRTWQGFLQPTGHPVSVRVAMMKMMREYFVFYTSSPPVVSLY